MRPLDTIFSEFLEQSGGKQDIALGPQEDSADFGATPEHKAWLLSQLGENAKFNRLFIIILIVLHFLIL